MHRIALDVPIIGLNVENMNHVQTAIANADEVLPSSMAIDEMAASEYPPWLSGSVMPDGSLYGVIHLDRQPRPDFMERESFRLH